MASTPSATPGNAFGLPLQKALSTLLTTVPVDVPAPPPVLQQYPQTPSRKGSGIIYKSRDDDSSLFQLASSIVLPEECIDVTDAHDIVTPECFLSEGTASELGAEKIGELKEGFNSEPESDLAHRPVPEVLLSTENAHSIITEDVVNVDRRNGDGQGHDVKIAGCVRGRVNSHIPLPNPREKTLIKAPKTDNPFDSANEAGLDFTALGGRRLSAKIDILRGPRRSPGSGPGSVCEGSVASTTSSHNAHQTGLGSTYGDDDYAEYPQGAPCLALVFYCSVLYWIWKLTSMFLNTQMM